MENWIFYVRIILKIEIVWVVSICILFAPLGFSVVASFFLFVPLLCFFFILLLDADDDAAVIDDAGNDSAFINGAFIDGGCWAWSGDCDGDPALNVGDGLLLFRNCGSGAGILDGDGLDGDGLGGDGLDGDGLGCWCGNLIIYVKII